MLYCFTLFIKLDPGDDEQRRCYEGRCCEKNTPNPKKSDQDVLIAKVSDTHSERVRVEFASLSFARKRYPTVKDRKKKDITFRTWLSIYIRESSQETQCKTM